MPKAVGGRVSVKVDGQVLLVKGNVTSNIGQLWTRESVVGLDQVHGYTEKPAVPFLACTITEVPEFPLSFLNQVTESTIQAELADGRTLILRQAAQVGDMERNPETGEVTVRFEGKGGDEMGA